MGVSDPKRTLTKMINGETKANLKKIEKLMSMSDFRKARSEARNWIQNSKGMNKFARDFMDAQLKSKTKAKKKIKEVYFQLPSFCFLNNENCSKSHFLSEAGTKIILFQFSPMGIK